MPSWRALLLCVLGFILDGRIQFIRVLQQIALGYLIVFPFVALGPWVQAVVAIFLLGGHTAAYMIYANALQIEPFLAGNNFGWRIDEWLHERLLIPPSRGHYVTFNAVCAAATIMFGVLAGNLLRSGLSAAQKILILTGVGCAGLVVGWALAGGDMWLTVTTPTVVPMVKRLWTSSFAIFAAGWTCLMLAAFYLVIDAWQFKSWSFPFVVVGMNSIAMYMAAELCGGNIRNLITRSIVPFFTPSTETMPPHVGVLIACGCPVCVVAVLLCLVQAEGLFQGVSDNSVPGSAWDCTAARLCLAWGPATCPDARQSLADSAVPGRAWD